MGLSDRVDFYVDKKSLDAMYAKYGKNSVDKTAKVMNTYMAKIERDAVKILNKNNVRDTGRLMGSISKAVLVYGGKVRGEVNAGTKYARFIHEGADHKGKDGKVYRRFVKFRVAPSLLTWAKRHKVIVFKKLKWRYVNKRGEQTAISVSKGGLMVKQEPVKFFEEPFENYKDKMADDIIEAVLQ